MFWLGLLLKCSLPLHWPHIWPNTLSPQLPVPIPSDPTEMQFRQMLPILEIPCWLKELHSFQEKDGFLKLFKMLENTSGRILVPEWEPLCLLIRLTNCALGSVVSILVMSMYIMLSQTRNSPSLMMHFSWASLVCFKGVRCHSCMQCNFIPILESTPATVMSAAALKCFQSHVLVTAGSE